MPIGPIKMNQKTSWSKLLPVLLPVLGLILAAPALAKNPMGTLQERAAGADGKAGLDEWEKPQRVFQKIDANGDAFTPAGESAGKGGMSMPASHTTKTARAGPVPDLAPDGYETVIADVHMHPSPFNDPSDLLVWMDRNGVHWAGGGPVFGSRKLREHYREVMGERYIPLGGQNMLLKIFFRHGVEGTEDADNGMFQKLMAELEEDFAAGRLKGIGEIFGNNRTSNPKPKLRRKSRIDAPTYKAMLDLAARFDGVIQIHVQMDEDSIQQLEGLADHNPDGIIVWAHCGSNSHPEQVRAVLQRHGNIFCDLSARHRPKLPPRVIAMRPHSEIFTAGSLDAGWKALIEDMPDRFMVGTDTKTEAHYDQGIETIRSGLLANLSAQTARKVAYQNAQKLFRLSARP